MPYKDLGVSKLILGSSRNQLEEPKKIKESPAVFLGSPR
jgi:hypothetical protein